MVEVVWRKTAQTKLVYYVNEKKGILYISALWDTRREPSALVRGLHSK